MGYPAALSTGDAAMASPVRTRSGNSRASDQGEPSPAGPIPACPPSAPPGYAPPPSAAGGEPGGQSASGSRTTPLGRPGIGVETAAKRSSGDGRRAAQIGDGSAFAVLETEYLPSLLFGKKLAQELVVDFVPGFVAGERPDQAVPQKVEVANGVMNLVPHQFVLVAQAFLVPD